jgi:ubiquinone/menaquinone biosynthesis C-methylase UbiE
MPDHVEIYATHAVEYERLVACEDYQDHILAALNEIIPFAGLDVVEFGAGTGRLTCMLAPLVKSIQAFDRSAHMLELAKAKLQRLGLRNWQVTVSDHRQVQARDGAADVAISGWSICYIKVWGSANWEAEVEKALGEMRRVVRRGGHVILLETLGTGDEVPQAPADLAAYYNLLERRGYQRSWIRTDYKFRDRAEAEQVAGFFFGAGIAAKFIDVEGGIILPECTGLWWQVNWKD